MRPGPEGHGWGRRARAGAGMEAREQGWDFVPTEEEGPWRVVRRKYPDVIMQRRHFFNMTFPPFFPFGSKWPHPAP